MHGNKYRLDAHWYVTQPVYSQGNNYGKQSPSFWWCVRTESLVQLELYANEFLHILGRVK